MNITHETIGKIRKRIKKLKRLGRSKIRRPIVDNENTIYRVWLSLDNHNSFPIPKNCLCKNLRGECFRFYIALLWYASKFKNPFNHSDRAIANDFGFHLSRIPHYKRELEALGLIAIGLTKPKNLKWPKSHYLILEFWDDPILSSL